MLEVGAMVAAFYWGYVLRKWLDDRRAKATLPDWRIGFADSVCCQIAAIQTGHKFAGDDVRVTSTRTYVSDTGCFTITVQRSKEEANGD